MEANIQNQLTILLWAIGGGFGVSFGIIAFLWSHINSRFDKVDEKFLKVDEKFLKVDEHFEKLENRLTRIENDMIEVKTILRLKEGCVIKDSSQVRKAE